mgnify:CR=1 FL=1
MKYLAICKCPAHNFYAVTIDDENGCGTRVTPSKCCGRWDTVKRWPITESMADSLLEEVAAAKESAS